MELEIIKLSKISQTKKGNYHMFSLIWNANLKINDRNVKRELFAR
jgi:hypothetical protein